MSLRLRIEPVGLAAAACVAGAIVAFYASRLTMPLPIFASDEAAYLIRALYPDNVVALNPSVAPIATGAHLSVIRAVYALGAPVVVGDRLVNAAAYLVGVLLMWRAGAAGLPRRMQFAALLLGLGFSYYRFAFSNLAEGLFVGVLALVCAATGRWYRARPLIHALASGTLCAVLVLVKPNGLATVAALAVVAALDAAVAGGWRRLPLRAAVFAAAFFAVGNLIQIGAEAGPLHPLTFFIGGIYGGQLAARPGPEALGLGLLTLASTASAVAVLAGTPILVGLADLAGRWRAARGRFQASGRDLVLLLLILALAATVAMVAVFAMKISTTPGESRRLWGRYFEFFAPLIWLAAAPALARPVGRRVALGCAAALAAGLAGLVASFQAGIVLFPWDSSVLTAFFQADPVRAPVIFALPYRALALLAGALAVAALALGARPLHAGLGLILALSALSTELDHVWVGPMVARRTALEHDIEAMRPRLPPRGADMVLLAPDENDGHLGFLRLDARPRTFIGPPGKVAPAYLQGAGAVVVAGPETPPGRWRRIYRGEELSLFAPLRRP